MALNNNKPVPPAVLAEDEESFDALKKMPGYTPSNPSFAIEQVTAKHTTRVTAESEERDATRALDAKHDAMVAAQWEFHNMIVGARQQVLAQFGENSDQVAAVGLKKRQEYKRPSRRQKGTPDAAKNAA